MVLSVMRLIRWPYDLVFNPSNIVDTASRYGTGSLVRRLWIAVATLIFFLLNVILYTLPLSLGQETDPNIFAIPQLLILVLDGFVEDVSGTAAFIIVLTENSLSLFYAAIATFLIYHFAIWITRKSEGWLRSLQIVTLSTGIYLAILLNLVIISIGTLPTTGGLLWGIQTEFVRLMIELFGSTHTVAGADPIDSNELTLIGQFVLIGLVISLCYYAYVLYLGARRVHDLSRFESAFVVGFLAVAPALYVSAAIIIIELTEIPPGLFGL